MTEKTVKNHCAKCNGETNHEIIGIHSETGEPDTYHCKIEHAVVKCCGCESVSFRKAFHDYENVFQIDDDEWDYDLSVEIYPKKARGHLDVSNAPEIVQSIYGETCSAFSDGSHTLAGIGFRATIEAICNDQGIAGKELYTRINSLAAKGLISKRDSTRLHSIRFLGNDAAHDIKKPSVKNLEAALTIIEHLLTTIYLIDSATKGRLEEVIENYNSFKSLLLKKLIDFKPADAFPIQKFFGSDARLLTGSTRSFEKQLIKEISTGEFVGLQVGKKVKFQNSKEELQHFVVPPVVV
jgi:Domain of unknown function (DUF4145)